MATVTIETLVDDIDGSEASSTVYFELDKAKYEIDLSEKNAAKLRGQLSKFIAAAQPVRIQKAKKITKQVVSTPSRREQAQAIRDWGRANGREVSDRGRVPGALLDAFHAAH